MTDARPLQPGDPPRLGSYEVTGRLGEGGQGVVYLGRSPAGDPVAIKLLRADLAEDAKARGRFLRELAAVKRVARFCTAQVLEADAEGDRPYIVSEYVPGPSLHQLVRDEGPRSGADLERLAIGTATALVAIHQAGIVHRDFKPQNVIIGPDGPRVIDFGIAKALDAAATMTNSAIGTPSYMSPEQVAGREITPATDIFAWGATMVFAATGRAPFGQDTVVAVIHRILNEQPDLGPLAEPLRGIVAGCLAKDPGARPSAQVLLMRLLGQEGAAAPAGAEPTAILGQGAAFAETMAAPAPTLPSGRPPTPPGAPTVARTRAMTVPPGAAATTMPGEAARRRPSGRALLAAVTGLLVAAGLAAFVVWMAGRGGDEPRQGPAPVPAPSSQVSTEEQPTRPIETAGPTRHRPPSSTPTVTSSRPTSTYTEPTHTDEPTDGSTGRPTGGATHTGGTSTQTGAPAPDSS